MRFPHEGSKPSHRGIYQWVFFQTNTIWIYVCTNRTICTSIIRFKSSKLSASIMELLLKVQPGGVINCHFPSWLAVAVDVLKDPMACISSERKAGVKHVCLLLAFLLMAPLATESVKFSTPSKSTTLLSANCLENGDSMCSRQSLRQRRAVQQAAISPAPEIPLDVRNISWILAGYRTVRRDPLDNLHKYQKGWDIRNEHYWASVGFTGLPGFLLALLWVALGILLLLYLSFFFCCGNGGKEQNEHSQQGFWTLFFCLNVFTCTVVAGCAVVYIGQAHLHDDISHTLEYVVNQSRVTVDNLHMVSTTLMEATAIDVDNIVVAPQEQQVIQQQSMQLKTSADQLESETENNAHQIRKGIERMRLAMIVVAGAMLVLLLAGISFVACGVRPCIYTLVLIGWLLIAATWILCGVFILLGNAVGDTCVSMQEWVAHPDVHTNLDDILPCDDQQTANGTLNRSKNMTITLVNVVNQAINGIINGNFSPGVPFYFNQSGPQVPSLCSPYGPAPIYASQFCPDGFVNFKTAAQTWSKYECAATNGVCTSRGRLPPDIYNEFIKAVAIADGLYTNVPFLVSVENCDFVRTTFQHTIDYYCPHLRRHIKWIWLGLVLVSGGSMVSVFLWVLCSKRHPRNAYNTKTKQGFSQPLNREEVPPQASEVGAL